MRSWTALLLSARLTSLAGAVAALSGQATAQDGGLRARIVAGVACAGDAGTMLSANVAAMAGEREAIAGALHDLAADTEVCAPIRSAASDALSALAHETLDEAAIVQQRMAQALREADARAAAMTFQVGPPPRNLTRTAAGGP